MAATDTSRRTWSTGFTLVEVIAVLIIIGILAAVAASRVGDNQSRVVAAADKLKVHLRHAQLRAMHSDTSWGVHNSSSSYWLYSGDDITSRSVFLGEEADTVPLPAGVSVSGFTNLSFDAWGRPYNGVDPASGSLLDSDQAVTVGNGHTVTITITRETGFIP
ncbi:pilus assembly FimT family protein [Desulfurivibrio dismutans]|uniref:pilus assembly FimT family protein n=1 Tax=Desulfurivibrio dismutans TaxID=1398908 RepID=UPI0023DCBCCD|nr:prepilin-type N-terminal cleavage/methylation domain-containing protein [Desulfurivibrio alkaliphilus]MDF1615442.1 prepilin-type N-terminal cleavage/methylation domain-containing protein [Desulfurivibrio alkaliphilus]